MARLNQVFLIGGLTRDPESRTFAAGGKKTSFSLATTGRRKKDVQTGEWEDEPCYVDCEAWDSQTGKGRNLASLIEERLSKGSRVFVQGRLVLDTWEKDGQRFSKLRVLVDDVQFLDKRPRDSGGEQESARAERSVPDEDTLPF